MTATANKTEQKMLELKAELKRNGLWKKNVPAWVTNFEAKPVTGQQSFSDWLQFVFLPNCTTINKTDKRNYIVPQAVQFFGDDVKKGKLLQLLIELDALL